MKKIIVSLAVLVSLGTMAVETSKKTSVKMEQPFQNKEVSVKVESTDQMTFKQTQIKVKEGQKVKLTLVHIGKMPKNVMGHNLVILKKGVNVAKFASEAVKAAATDYIPKGSKDIIANTKVIGGGESATVTFTAPKKGSYDYICSFPGHYAIMKGKLIVE